MSYYYSNLKSTLGRGFTIGLFAWNPVHQFVNMYTSKKKKKIKQRKENEGEDLDNSGA